MRKLFDSGVAFIIVAILCYFAGILAGNGTLFKAIGGFWLVLGIIVMAKNAKKPKDQDQEG